LDYERNKILLEDGPGEAREGLLFIYTLNLRAEDGDGFYSARINNGILEKLGISEEILKEQALDQMAKISPVNIMPLDEMMTVVSNQDNNLGAAALFYPGVMEEVAGMMGSFYAVPSSIHEWMCIKEEKTEPEMLLSLLRETNKSGFAVKELDVLSDNLYHYDAELKRFERVFFEEDFRPVTSTLKGGVLYA